MRLTVFSKETVVLFFLEEKDTTVLGERGQKQESLQWGKCQVRSETFHKGRHHLTFCVYEGLGASILLVYGKTYCVHSGRQLS